MSRPFSYNDENFTVKYNHKCYFSCKNDIAYGDGRYIFGIFMLKDI